MLKVTSPLFIPIKEFDSFNDYFQSLTKSCRNSLTLPKQERLMNGLVYRQLGWNVNYIKEFIRIDLTILYNVFKYYWLQSYFNLIKMEKDLLEKKRSTLKFNEKEYEYVNRAIKNIKRDERKLKKNAMYF